MNFDLFVTSVVYPDVHWSLLFSTCSCFCTQEFKCTDVTQFYTYFHFKKIVSLCILISVAVLFLIFFNFILLIDTLQIAHVLKNTCMTPDSFYRTDWFSFYLTKGFFIYIACTNDFCLNCKVKWNNTQARFRNAPFLISKQGFKYDFC